MGNTPSSTSQSIGGADNYRVTDLFGKFDSSVNTFHNSAFRNRFPDLLHHSLEHLTVFCLLNRFQGSAQESDPFFSQNSPLSQRYRNIKPNLSAQGRQQTVRLLLPDNLGHKFGSERFNIHPIGNIGVSHNSCRVAVDQDYFHTFFL